MAGTESSIVFYRRLIMCTLGVKYRSERVLLPGALRFTCKIVPTRSLHRRDDILCVFQGLSYTSSSPLTCPDPRRVEMPWRCLYSIDEMSPDRRRLNIVVRWAVCSMVLSYQTWQGIVLK